MVRTIEVSIIVPVYNEEKRMVTFVRELLSFCKRMLKSYECLFVNDGSSDKSVQVLRRLLKGYSNARVISHKHNQGKGAAIQTGIENSKGDKILFIDADGSIQPKEIPIMIKKLDKYDVVAGSRALKKSRVRQNLIRKLTSHLFNPYVNLLFRNDIPDHLCGFKGFKSEVAKDLFSNLMETKWLFDVEVFYRMRNRQYSFCEIPLIWVHKEKSKMGIFEPLKMVFRLIVMRLLIDKNEK